MRVNLVTPPTIEPITIAELKAHLRIDSGSFSGNIDETPLLPSANHAVNTGYTLLYELLTLDVAPGGAGWSAGDTITGQSSTKTCKIVEVLTATTYTIRDRSGAFTLGEILTNGVAAADQGAAYPTVACTKVEVIGYSALVTLEAGLFTTGTTDANIQDSDDGITWADWTGGAFTQVSAAAGNDNAIQEIAYTGAKRYIRTAAKVLVAACPFSITVIRLTATTVEDALLTSIITASREHIEDITRRALLTQTWDYYLQAWPSCGYIRLPYGNLQTAGLSVKWKDTSGTETTLTLTTDYLIETNGAGIGRIALPYGESWPSGTLYPSNPITIRFAAGWTTAALVPSTIKAMLLFHAEDLYTHGERSKDLQDAIARMLPSARLYDEF